MPRNIASEILEGLQEAADYLSGQAHQRPRTTVNVPEHVDSFVPFVKPLP